MDELLPNEGSYYLPPDEPEEQQMARRQEQAKTTAAIPMLKDLIERWQTKVAFYDSIDSIAANIDDEPELFQRIHAANKVIKQGFELELDYLESLLITHSR